VFSNKVLPPMIHIRELSEHTPTISVWDLIMRHVVRHFLRISWDFVAFETTVEGYVTLTVDNLLFRGGIFREFFVLIQVP